MIVDLSFPDARSVNDGISPELCSLKYSSVNEAVQFVTALGPGTNLIKVDLKSAHRIVPIHPDDRHLLGICWEGNIYVDQALPFGLHSAPMLFTAVADALGWAVLQAGTPYFIHYLDDYLFFVPPTDTNPGTLLSSVLATFSYLGVPVALNKIEGPATAVTFLGIVIDTISFELTLYIRQLIRGGGEGDQESIRISSPF